MAWPPPTLPINRTDATPQQTTHAADHNAANLAINDIVNLCANSLPIKTNLTGVAGTFGNFTVVSGTSVVTTDGSGNAVVTLAAGAFSPGATPIVVPTNGDVAQGAGFYGLSGSPTPANFTIRATRADTGGPFTGAAVRVSYIGVAAGR